VREPIRKREYGKGVRIIRAVVVMMMMLVIIIIIIIIM
jgi:hypothetical protein